MISGTRLIALYVPAREKGKTLSGPGSFFGRGLTIPQGVSILERLQDVRRFLFSVKGVGTTQSIKGGKDPPKTGDYIVEVDGYYYDYYIPSGETLLHPMVSEALFVCTGQVFRCMTLLFQGGSS